MFIPLLNVIITARNFTVCAITNTLKRSIRSIHEYHVIVIISLFLLVALLTYSHFFTVFTKDKLPAEFFDHDILVSKVSGVMPMVEYFPSSNNCNIIVPEDPVDSLFGDKNKADPYLKSIIIGHEKAHCMFYRIFEKEIAKQLKSRGESYSDNGQIYNKLLGENFADTYAVMAMLNHYEYSKDAVESAKKWYTFRKDNRLSLVVYMDDIHYTDYSVQIALETIERQKKVVDKEALMTMAFEWATTGSLKHARQSRHGFGISGYGRIERIDKERLQAILETQCGSRAPPFNSF